MSIATEVQLCHWRWIPDLVNRYVWTQDPEFRRSKGGGGIVVARVAAYPKSTRREGIRLILVKPQWRHGQYGFWINGKHTVKGKVRFGRHMTETEILHKSEIWKCVNSLEGDPLQEEIPFTSVANLSGEGVLHRVKSDCRDLGGKRIEITAMWNGKPDGMTLEIMRNAEKCPWQVMDGSDGYLQFRLVGYYRKKPFGDVKSLSISPDGRKVWTELIPHRGEYEFTSPDGDGGMWTRRIPFWQIVKGLGDG